jgi:hypothetical protein
MISVRALTTVFLLASLGLASCAGRAVPPEAQPGAEAWLGLVDAGRYAESWTEAAAYFKGAVDAKSWERQVGAVRTPIGKLQSRAVKSAKAATSLPGAPDGEYVVFQFDTSFERKATAVETVTVSKETDGAWRVSGYYIK